MTNETPNAGPAQRKPRSWPAWLDGRTIALLATMATLGAMMQTTHSRLASEIHRVRDDLGTNIEKLRDDLGTDIEKVRDDLGTDIEKVRDDLGTDIERVRDELSADIAKLDDRLRSVEIGVAAIRTATTGFDARLRAVEEHARHAVPSPPAGQRGSASDRRDVKP